MPGTAGKAAGRRIGVVGIVISRREDSAARVQEVLGEFADLIVGRMGIPYRERGVSVIAIIVDGDTDRLGAMTGRLGAYPGVTVKSALTAFQGDESASTADKESQREEE
jgi:putative iron-only hydrogenase system regulator